ncbi:hypothetical protein [Niveibacterium sp. SC-1]|uniref:hypothetical protein n=1 Tax=Niveibacterium sp. SC-1 TaxID=3135646 RepID=UPI00311DFC13
MKPMDLSEAQDVHRCAVRMLDALQRDQAGNEAGPAPAASPQRLEALYQRLLDDETAGGLSFDPTFDALIAEAIAVCVRHERLLVGVPAQRRLAQARAMYLQQIQRASQSRVHGALPGELEDLVVTSLKTIEAGVKAFVELGLAIEQGELIALLGETQSLGVAITQKVDMLLRRGAEGPPGLH